MIQLNKFDYEEMWSGSNIHHPKCRYCLKIIVIIIIIIIIILKNTGSWFLFQSSYEREV